MIKTKKQMFIVIGAFALILLLGTASYAFFNYTRTGSANNINTGKINFQSTQTQNPVTVSNLFPIKAEDIPTAATTFNASTSKFARVIVHVEGETTWEEGLDYVVSAIDTNLQVGTSLNKLPLKVHVYESTDANTHTGDLTGDSLTLPYETANTLTEGKVTLASGHIAGNSTYGNGTRYKRDIVIDAYILASDVAITDTPEESSEWVNGRTRYSTIEWNALATSGASFKIIVESNETQPTPAPAAGSIASCPGCKFMYPSMSDEYEFGGANNPNATLVADITGTVTTDYRTLNVTAFIGFTETQDGKIDRAFACGIKGENPNQGTPFCIEAALSDANGGNSTTRAAVYANNQYVLNDSTNGIWQGGCTNNGSGISCSGLKSAEAKATGGAYVGSDSQYSYFDEDAYYCAVYSSVGIFMACDY